MPQLPTGTVTLLFTDIEGSTKLLQELGDLSPDELAGHRRVLREVFQRHGGVEVDTQGDAFFYVFVSAREAVTAAAEAQTALEPSPIRVRMGVHTGEPIVGVEGYVGIDVHRAARIMSAGHGGQILLSESTQQLVDERFPLLDLGVQRLKDMTAPERVYQLGKAEFPPLQTLNRTNLPVAMSPLIGRNEELREVLLLLRNAARVVTLTGPGGSGKTRLAIQVAAELVDAFHEGTFWVPLAGLGDPELVIPTVAQSLGTKDELKTFLAARKVLLLLDNFEHLLEAAGSVAELLDAAPMVKMLVTSRAPLHIGGEEEVALDSLHEVDSVTLFVERARAVGRKLEASPVVAEICRRLDCLPLAIELAAARAKLMEPDALLDRLEQRLPLLTGGRRDVPERQRTLAATIQWSYDLLGDEEKRVFAALSVFSGSFSLAAAEDVSDADLQSLAGLVDLSLLKPIADSRFLMLETIREYALQRLQELDSESHVKDRHARFFLGLAEEAEPHLQGGDRQREWLDRMEAERDNLRAAVATFAASGNPEEELRLVAASWWFWWIRGYVGEIRRVLVHALARNPGETLLRARALEAVAFLAYWHGDFSPAETLTDELVALGRKLDEPLWISKGLHIQSMLSLVRGQYERAEAQEREGLELLRGDAYARYPHHGLGYLALLEGDSGGAREHLRVSAELSEQAGDHTLLSGNLSLMGLAALDENGEEAEALILRGLAESQNLGDRAGIWNRGVVGVAGLLARRGFYEESARLLGTAERVREDNKIGFGVLSERFQAGVVVELERHLGEPICRRLWEEGRRNADEAALTDALRHLD